MMYDVLAGEIVQPQYADMTDAEIAEALNAPGASTRRRVGISELQARAMESGVYTALRVVVGNAQAPAELRAVAQTVLDLANARFADVDMDNASAVHMFGALQQAGVITAQQAAQIDALATLPGVSRAEELGLGVVAGTDIEMARQWQAIQALRQRLANGYNTALVMLAAATVAPAWADVVAVVEAS